MTLLKKLLFKEAMTIFKADQDVCRRMGEHGAKLIVNGMRCLTICNAGALATADYGTALGVFYTAKRKAKKFSVYSLRDASVIAGGEADLLGASLSENRHHAYLR